VDVGLYEGNRGVAKLLFNTHRREVDMERFVIRPTTWPVLRLLSRNPLMRTSDYIEAAVTAVAGLLVLIAIPCAGIVGTMIHDARAQTYLEQARTRHALVAKAVADSEPAVLPGTVGSTVSARWRVDGVDHFTVLRWDTAVKAGDPLQIWVDDAGNRVDPPSPVERAAFDAVSAAVVGWFIVALAAAQVVVALRAHVNRMRDIQLEREIRSLVSNGGGRTNSSQ
jgi:hypothetical protein